MSKPRQLTPIEARRTLANRLIPTVDRLRQRLTTFGLRPYNVFVVWTKWTGKERGEGHEVECKRIAIVPNPKVEELTSITLNPFSAGLLPVGTVRVSGISGSYTQDLLSGLTLPKKQEEEVPEPYSFFWEIVEDGRGDDPPVRSKFRLFATPFRRAGQVDWTVLLERISEDLKRDGCPNTDGEIDDD